MSVRSTTLPAIAALLLATGCGKSDAPPPDGATHGSSAATGAALLVAPRNAGGSGSATVSFKPGVQVIEQADGYNALVSVSTDGS
ncbi:MAG: hypothetical protein JWL95_2529, partial [Gemmatimonadetes bacterium]|nr:hypothetical protein [Gemmatimonadota bacterium]